MSNPMLALLNRSAQQGRAPTQTQSKAGAQDMNPMQMIREFNKFKQIMRGRDPQAILNKLLESGEMSREQLEEYKGMAQDLLNFLK